MQVELMQVVLLQVVVNIYVFVVNDRRSTVGCH